MIFENVGEVGSGTKMKDGQRIREAKILEAIFELAGLVTRAETELFELVANDYPVKMWALN